MACAFGPFYPWNTPASLPRLAKWDSATDEWELYNLKEDFSQANNLAVANPTKTCRVEEGIPRAGRKQQSFSHRRGNWLRLHPEDRVKTPYTT